MQNIALTTPIAAWEMQYIQSQIAGVQKIVFSATWMGWKMEYIQP